MPSDCGGQGTCGRCLVRPEGEVSPPEEAERQTLARIKAPPGYRLACRARALADQNIFIPQGREAQAGDWQVIEHQGEVLVGRPAVLCREIGAAPPSIEDQRCDLRRISDCLADDPAQPPYRATPAALAQISRLAREHDWRFNALSRGREIVGALATGQGPLGLAVDLGTTKLAAYLLELDSGRLLAAQGLINPQAPFGADVISRLNRATQSPEDAAELAAGLRRAVDRIARQLLEQAGADPAQLADFCLVGNTAIIQLLLELPARQLALSPFVCSSDLPQDIPARDLGLTAAPGAWVHIPPGIGGFVGADHVAMILGTDLDRGSGLRLGLDIGTNTEIALALPGGDPPLLVASAPSGPAFEGAHLACGMRLGAGAVGRVWHEEGRLAYATVDGGAPAGLCGSGIIDAVAALLGAGLLDRRGHLIASQAGVRQGGGGPEYLLAPAGDTTTGQDLAISQDDLVQVQLAKAAIIAGVRVLLAEAKVDEQDLDEVVLAGSFGSHFDVDSAMDIGMLPRLDTARYRQVGNAAGRGAQMMLADLDQRQRAALLPGQTRYLELTTKPEFRRLMTRSLAFTPA